jgi:ubiquinone/menaquinone biosynthesis C-methylase UbiE
MDIWLQSAITGNRSNSVLQNARVEHVSDRVEIKEGDARNLPFADATFDAVVSNFVVHELRSPEERQTMMREIARVLKPGGHVALADFIFTNESVADLKMYGVDAVRRRDNPFSFWLSAILIFSAIKTYHVVGTKT